MTFKVIDKKTGKEADTYKIALKEDWAKHLIYCDMEGFAIEEDGSLVLMDECGNVAYCPADRFEIVFEEEEPQGEYVDISKLRLMTVEECAGHTIDYAMGWKACIEWIKKGGAE